MNKLFTTIIRSCDCKSWVQVKAELRAEHGMWVDGVPVWHDVLLEAGILVI